MSKYDFSDFDEPKAKYDFSDFDEQPKAPQYDYSNVGQVAKDVVKAATIDGLPVYGQAIGSTIGMIGGPAGMAAGGGLGQAAGESLRKGLYSVGELITGERPLSDELRLPTKEEVAQVVNDTGKAFIEGSTAEAGGQVAGKVISSGIKAVAKPFTKSAEALAVKATGATGKQSEKYADNVGRELLDRKIVGFWDDAENIANKAQSQISKAENTIDTSLKALDEKGVTVSADKIVEKLQSRIEKLKGDASQAQTVRQLQGIVDDIIETGNSTIKVSEAEQTKRGFNKIAKNWMDPRAGVPGKSAYSEYKTAVEAAAKEADPEVASKFIDAKKTYGLLNPVAEFAGRRADTLNQSPIGGLLDVATATVPGAGLPAAIATSATRRIVAPRLASSGAVLFDKVGKAANTVGRGIEKPLKEIISKTGSAMSVDPIPQKGINKWISNGQDRVIETDASLDKDFLRNYAQSKNGKNDLIRASELKPKSTQMNQMIEKIKSSEEYKQFQKEKEKQAQGKEPDQSSVKPIQNEKFPKSIRKGSQTAVVKNVKELYEAISEGWA